MIGAARYFSPRYWAQRFWPKTSGGPVTVDPDGEVVLWRGEVSDLGSVDGEVRGRASVSGEVGDLGAFVGILVSTASMRGEKRAAAAFSGDTR